METHTFEIVKSNFQSFDFKNLDMLTMSVNFGTPISVLVYHVIEKKWYVYHSGQGPINLNNISKFKNLWIVRFVLKSIKKGFVSALGMRDIFTKKKSNLSFE